MNEYEFFMEKMKMSSAHVEEETRELRDKKNMENFIFLVERVLSSFYPMLKTTKQMLETDDQEN